MATKYTSKLAGKRVLVLGGTSGIGFCVAEACIEYGAIVTVSSSNQTRIDAAVQRITTAYPDARDRITGKPCDLSSASTVEDNILALYEFATEHGQHKLDHVVTTAGDALKLPNFDEITVQDTYASIQVRWIGGIMLTKHAKRYMNDASTSSITLTSGVNGQKPQPGWQLVAAGVNGVEGLVRGSAVTLKPIRVNAVSPGAILTEMWDNLGPDMKKHLEEKYSASSLVGHLGAPEDTAETYLYLMKDRFITGQAILTDGGSILV